MASSPRGAMSTIDGQAQEPPRDDEKSLSPTTTAPRKRRRRPPVTGAADDCFTCQERQSKCDRRRPYCTQCLDLGKDCSGYKTTLTWGVGVASRGKLRGLSLPIASSKKAAQSTEEDDAKLTHGPRKSAKLGPTRTPSDPNATQARTSPPSTASASRHADPTTYDFVNMDATFSPSATSPMLPPPAFDFCGASSKLQPPSQSRSHGARQWHKRIRRHSIQPLQGVAHLHPARDYGSMPMTASIVGGYGHHHDFAMPGHPSPRASPMIPTFTGYGLVSPTYTSQPMISNISEGSYFAGVEGPDHWHREGTSSVSSDHNSLDFTDGLDPFFADIGLLPSQPASFPGASDPSALMTETKYSFAAPPSPELTADDLGQYATRTIPRLVPSLSIGNTPKLQFLINYYDKVISPVIVAFDGPTNPYRSHILSLAVESETLQHAIAALAASNIRMRREHTPKLTGRRSQSIAGSTYDQSVRRSSMAHSMMDVDIDGLPQTSNNEPSHDELFHKSTSIRTLNEQLADPNRRQDDSILATLLILCLYHICDTGVAKFKTQFAGVKKILALRGGSKGTNSKACNWLTIMFTWFDAMTATLNDREGQLNGDDISGSSGDEWALENLAGCDGRLFKIIAKLGRLNLLSQGKPVSENTTTSPKLSPPSQPLGLSQDYYSMSSNVNAAARFDGNGWSTLPQSPIAHAVPLSYCEMAADTPRAQFWHEWTEIRRKLYEWQLDTTAMHSPVGAKQSDRRDLYHISESFRYSALLYTERLAHPDLPSIHPNFQGLVTQALFHISNVKSDVFLLWPLFITGTECVSEQGRWLIRERCLDIQKDSGFFNNMTGLELLEKVWREDDEPVVSASVTAAFAAAGGSGSGNNNNNRPQPQNHHHHHRHSHHHLALPRSADSGRGVAGAGMGSSSAGMVAHSGPGPHAEPDPLPVTGMGIGEFSSVGGRGFKWRRAMERVDGEYIVV